MEDIVLPVHYLIGIEVMQAHILGHFFLLDDDVSLDDGQWGFGNCLPYEPGNLGQILVDISPIDGLHEVLDHLHNKEQHMIMLLRAAILPQLHGQKSLKSIVLQHDTQTMQAFLQRQENITAQVGVTDGVEDLDGVVVGRVCDQLDYVFHLLLDVKEVEV